MKPLATYYKLVDRDTEKVGAKWKGNITGNTLNYKSSYLFTYNVKLTRYVNIYIAYWIINEFARIEQMSIIILQKYVIFVRFITIIIIEQQNLIAYNLSSLKGVVWCCIVYI